MRKSKKGNVSKSKSLFSLFSKGRQINRKGKKEDNEMGKRKTVPSFCSPRTFAGVRDGGSEGPVEYFPRDSALLFSFIVVKYLKDKRKKIKKRFQKKKKIINNVHTISH